MKRIVLRTLCMSMALLLLLSICSTAFAATVSKFTLTSASTGCNVKTFYVNTTNKKTATLSYSCSAAFFTMDNGGSSLHYGYFEVQTWGRNDTDEDWEYISKKNMKGVGCSSLSLKGYTQYRVRVYSWKTTTIGKTIGKVYTRGIYVGNCNWSGAKWDTKPTCTFKASSSNIKNLAVVK